MQTPTFTYPQKPQPNDKIAILSPSSGLPEIFPAVFEQGLQRLRDIFQLVPVEYPTMRKMNTPLEERAHDVHAAFADPEIKAIICSIGGDDQINESTWRPQGSPLLYNDSYTCSRMVVATLVVAMLTRSGSTCKSH